uniref:tetrahydrofolate synthase n=1 Tax=Saccoglossus kowalevskii TaxID=10224 RepID=A0ABM0MEI7_SACKO|nr:PREDICTED: uncharacterized protein LOC102800632 [Saccoglossus kowalevskii]
MREVKSIIESIGRDHSRAVKFRSKSWYSTKGLPVMRDHLKRVDISLDDVDGLNIIHVSGTKGKGSVSAFCESILRATGFKTGLYSSPHLVELLERIRINGLTLTRDAFSKYFFDVYNKLEKTRVDVVILEVGIGGAYDCTNIVQSPRVVGITLLDLDHTDLLGDTIDSIAWHKAGICKPGRPAFTIPQVKEAMDTVRRRANEIHAPIQIVPDLDDYDWQGKPMKLGLAGEHQRINASLAIQLCRTWIEEHNLHHSDKRAGFGHTNTYSMDGNIQTASAFKLPATFISGLRDCCLPGRTQIIKHDNVTYYLDGAHTPMSMKACVKWFKEASAEEEQILNSQHLVDFRERIRINGLTRTRSVFSKYFFDVHNKLDSTKCGYPETILNRFRSMTLMALNVFIHEKLDDVDGLNIIHVSGTKGKGSVTAFCESILRANGFKTGLYSSPHLVEFRERIRINGLTLTRDVFSKYFFDVYNKLESTKCGYPETILNQFRFMTLVALNVFIHEKVDVVILEVGVGGAYDCTNIVQSPRVVGITLLDLDHTDLLGDTIDSISWHKAGICKPGRPAFTIPQVKEAIDTVRRRATEIHAPIQIVPDLDDYDWQGKPMKLGLAVNINVLTHL